MASNLFGFFRDNFLELDIYYKRMSYMEIRQQPVFELLSFLSEVGGFLGLGLFSKRMHFFQR